MSSAMAEWGRRTAIALGVALGVGLVTGGVYYIVKSIIEEHLAALETKITAEIHQLRQHVGELKVSIDGRPGGPGVSSIALLKRPSQRGNDNGDEYFTASESEDEEGPSVASNRTKKGGGAQTGNEMQRFIAQMSALLDGNDKSQHDAYVSLKANQEKYKSSCDYWAMLAKATHIEANSGPSDKKEDLTYAAFDCAEKALKISDQKADAHKWYAITLGSKGDYLKINEKIKNGFTFKEHIDKAIKLNPNDATLYHLLGRFCYEVATLSWIERKMAATLFSAPPTATPQDALTNFQTCERLGKPFKENRLFIARAYIAMNENRKAAYWLDVASKLPVNTGSDRSAQEEVAKLLPKYRKYLN